MANIIKVDTSKLRTTASALGSTSSQVVSATKSMTETVNSLTGAVWTGEAASAFTKKFSELSGEIQQIDKMVQEHIDDLNKIAEGYDKAEEENKAAANALASDLF